VSSIQILWCHHYGLPKFEKYLRPALRTALRRIYAGFTPALRRRYAIFKPPEIMSLWHFILLPTIVPVDHALSFVAEADDTEAPAYYVNFHAARSNELFARTSANRSCSLYCIVGFAAQYMYRYYMKARHATASCTNPYCTVREKNHFISECARGDTNTFVPSNVSTVL
jgi:hypothetical protein